MEEADEEHVDATNPGRREAIGGAGARASGAHGECHSRIEHLSAGDGRYSSGRGGCRTVGWVQRCCGGQIMMRKERFG
jgi:hypothetical protein